MTEKMPVLFVGHGNPMNVMEDNEFSRAWDVGRESLAKTQSGHLYLRTLGHAWNHGHCHGQAAHHL